MRRKTVPNKVRALLQKEISSECPFCNNQDVDHFEVHHIDNNNQNNGINNLFMVCPLCHSKITKGDISRTSVIEMKTRLSRLGEKEKTMAKQVNFNNKVSGAVIVGDNNTVNITNNKTSVQRKYPEGSIGSDLVKRNYISYLISRFNKFKEYEVGKDKMKYNLLGAQLKRKFKIGQTSTIYYLPVEQFNELLNEIQTKIDGTKLGRINKGKSIEKNYDSFDEYILNQRLSSII